jgi:hypothetical protein
MLASNLSHSSERNTISIVIVLQEVVGHDEYCED